MKTRANRGRRTILPPKPVSTEPSAALSSTPKAQATTPEPLTDATRRDLGLSDTRLLPRPPGDESANLARSATGAYFFFAPAKKAGDNGGLVIDTRKLDEAVGPLLARLDPDTPVVLADVRMSGARPSKYADRLREVSSDQVQGGLVSALAEMVGRKVVVLSPTSFPAAFQDAIDDSAILSVATLDLGRSNPAFCTHGIPLDEGAERPVFVETFAEFPKLLSFYLRAMESIKSLLVVIRDLGDNVAKAPLRQALLQELAEQMDGLSERREIVSGLPPMNLEDVKMNLAGLLTLARQQQGKVRAADELVNKVASLRRLIDHRHEFRLPIEDLPADLQAKIDQNNVVLASLETEARLALVERVHGAVAGQVDGINLLGSASWGAYYEVKASSDIDMEVMVDDFAFHQLLEAFDDVAPSEMSAAQMRGVLQKGRGRLVELARSLLGAGFVAGDSDDEQLRQILTRFHVFAQLRTMPLDDPDVKNETGLDLQKSALATAAGQPHLADYLSYKIDVDGVPVSLHVVSSAAFEAAARLDLVGLDRTRTLNEVRVGARKKVATGAKEQVSVDTTVYPDKRSFDGRSLDHACDVVAVVDDEPGTLTLVRPSSLPERGIGDNEVLAWITPVPVAVQSEGRMYHGVFQDKVMWGHLDEGTAPNLVSARRAMLEQMVDRMIDEMSSGVIDGSKASLLELSSRRERIPAYSQRALLKALAQDAPQAFERLASAYRQAGSEELDKLGADLKAHPSRNR